MLVSPFAAAAVVQGAAIVGAAALAAAVLVLPDGRRRALAMLGALLAAAVGLSTLVGETVGDQLDQRAAVAVAAAGAGIVVVGAIAALVHRRPPALALLAVGALPFRVPISYGDDAANLLLPLYAVIAGGAVAYAIRALRTAEAEPAAEDRDRRLVRVERVLAAVVVLYALQALYSSDLERAVKNVCFFYVPFAVLFRLLADLPWSLRLLKGALGLTVGLALACALVGFVEYATGHLLIPNPKVLAANELKPYFRVNSLFFDPNIYGRFLTIAMVPLAVVLLWTRRTRTAWLIAGALAVLWAGLVLSLSQSSFASLLAGLVVVAALRWRPAPVTAMVATLALAGVAVLVFAPTSVGLSEGSERAVNRATAGRLDLTRGAVEMARDRPVWGFGSGAFSDVYRKRERVWSPEAAAESHTIPLTIAAEQGAIGVAGYLALMWATLTLLFGGVREGLRRRPGPASVARVAVVAGFCALVVHTLAYAAFLEDPLLWTLLAVGAATRLWRPADPQPAA